MATTAPDKALEILTPEAAAMMDQLFSNLFKRWQTTADALKESEALRRAEAAEYAEERRQHLQAIRERDLKIDDLSQREFTLQEKLDLERIESEAMRGEIRHLRAIANAAADRVESAVMREVSDRHERRTGARNAALDVQAIEEALSKVADDENARNVVIERVSDSENEQ